VTTNVPDFVNVFHTTMATYTPSDLVLWNAHKKLDITPKFQRRAVWRTPAKSYFIDTMLRGMPTPSLYLRMIQNESATDVVREVVDGQQRVRTVLEYVNGDFKLKENLKNAPWRGKLFSQLTKKEQDRLMAFNFSTETFSGISDKQVREVFCRLNMNSIGLNSQELRNGRFFGWFKQTSYQLADDYLAFWRRNRIFGEQALARMLEVELTSELLIAGHAGMQDTKKTLDKFYDDWEESYPDMDKDEKRFREVFSTIGETFHAPDDLQSFRRPPLFYTLFCVIYHYMFGMPGVKRSTPRRSLKELERTNLRDAVVKLSEKLDLKGTEAVSSGKFARFVAATQRGTEKIGPRKIRFDSLYDEAF
jgi:hypothetical protein